MSTLEKWAQVLRDDSTKGVADLLRGAARIEPFERLSATEFLLGVLPVGCRVAPRKPLLGEPNLPYLAAHDPFADLHDFLDAGLAAWFLSQRSEPLPPSQKRMAYAAQVSQALQLPLYFLLPQTVKVLQLDAESWMAWLNALKVTSLLDPEYDYWQVLATRQLDDRLSGVWASFLHNPGSDPSSRYSALGRWALDHMPHHGPADENNETQPCISFPTKRR